MASTLRSNSRLRCVWVGSGKEAIMKSMFRISLLGTPQTVSSTCDGSPFTEDLEKFDSMVSTSPLAGQNSGHFAQSSSGSDSSSTAHTGKRNGSLTAFALRSLPFEAVPSRAAPTWDHPPPVTADITKNTVSRSVVLFLMATTPLRSSTFFGGEKKLPKRPLVYDCVRTLS